MFKQLDKQTKKKKKQQVFILISKCNKVHLKKTEVL